MQTLLKFPDDHRVSSAPLCFVAIVASSLSAEDLQVLSPRFMAWDEHVWILDLAPCLSYWQLQAQTQEQTLMEVLQKILDHLGKDQTYYAALACHPWQALLLAHMLERKGFRGLTAHSQRTARNLLGSLTWDSWWACAERYVSHMGSSKQSNFLKQKRAMQLAMKRLGCDAPMQLKNMPSSQIRRRFGSLVAQLWEQSFTTAEDPRSLDSSFPWHAASVPDPLICTRHLDFPLNDWQVIEPLLREDLNRFCVLDSFKKGERILNLEWRIVLYNLQEIPISVLFRHPHCLHRESPHQRTALLQVSYAFQQTLRSLRERQEEAPWMISWELRLLHTLRPLPQQQSLFADEKGAWEDLLILENQLDRPLEAYQIREDWLPEDSFVPMTQESENKSEYWRPFHHLGQHRPLFILQEPQPWTAYGQSLLWKFRERTMDKWWHSHSNTVRDYYQVVSQEQVYWVFRDAKGQCFLHGVYA